jgi:hypothetical protein
VVNLGALASGIAANVGAKAEAEFLQVQAKDNPATRAQFEAKSRSRWVLVQGEAGSDFPGTVTGFLPSSQLQVLDTEGRIHVTRLEHVVQDIARAVWDDERVGSVSGDQPLAQNPFRIQEQKPNAKSANHSGHRQI